MASTFTPEQIAQILEEFFNTVGTRQYIGARYVPIFGRKDAESIEWDNTGTYEPLTIVLYQGHSYTSRQYVPVGVEITNQEFWALTGNYNAQVEQYRQTVLSFNDRITTNENNIDSISDAMPISEFSSTNTVKKYVDDNVDAVSDVLPISSFSSTDTVKKYVDDNVDAVSDVLPISSFSSTDTVKKYVDDGITNLQNEIQNLSFRKAIYLGNSYSIGTGSTGGNNGLYERTKYVFDESELLWVSSIGFVPYTYNNVSVTSSFLTLLSNRAASMTQDEKDEITDIVVISAVGDDRIIQSSASGLNLLANGITNFCTFVKNNFANAKIHIAYCSSNSTFGLGDVSPSTMYLCNQRFIRSLNSNDYHYIGCVGYMIAHLANCFSADGYHPSDTGYGYMAPLIATAIKNNSIMQYPNVLREISVVNESNSKTMQGIIRQEGVDHIRIKLYSDNNTNLQYAAGETIPTTFTCDISKLDAAIVYDSFYSGTNSANNRYRSSFRGMARIATLNGSAPVQYIPFSCAVSSSGVLTFTLSQAPAELTAATYLWFIDEIVI